jgi:hypothetical protein
MQPFVGNHLRHAASNFRGNGGSTPRCHVAAGIEQNFSGLNLSVRRRNFHGRSFSFESKDGTGNKQ